MQDSTRRLDQTRHSFDDPNLPTPIKISSQTIYPTFHTSQPPQRTNSPAFHSLINPSNFSSTNKHPHKIHHKKYHPRNPNTHTTPDSPKLPQLPINAHRKLDSSSIINASKIMKLPAYSNFHIQKNISKSRFGSDFGGFVQGVNRSVQSKVM
jgi:hypothetical protein